MPLCGRVEEEGADGNARREVPAGGDEDDGPGGPGGAGAQRTNIWKRPVVGAA